MTEELEQPTEEVVPSGGDGKISAREAANQLSGYREKRDSGEAPQTEETAPAPEPADFTTKVDPEAQPGEDEPAIEPPRSWNADEKARFSTLPRETQEYLTRRENERDTALRRGQNEAATARQTLEAEKQAIDQMRKQYEQALPILAQQLQQQQMGEFADIKTQADVDNLARNDWQRFAMWQAHRMKQDSVNQEIQANYQRQQQEYVQRWNAFTQNEDSLFMAQAPEMSNPEEALKIANQAVSLLRNTGFSDDDLNQLWNGKASVSLRDHRMQLIVRDAARYRAAKESAPTRRATAPASKTLRPGTPAERATDAQVGLDALNKNLDHTGKWKDAAELLLARRAARR